MRRALTPLALLAAFWAALWLTSPDERLPPQSAIRPGFPPDLPVERIDSWLLAREAGVPGLIEGTDKTVVWAGAPGRRTPLALVYLHGFSASRGELEPVPQVVAAALGANLFLTRLAGHGQGGAALGRVRAADWALDLDEAVGLGRRLGSRVVLIGTSTGGSLAALAAADPALREGLAGLVLVSPNFGLHSAQARVLDLPHVRRWLRWVAGTERGFDPQSSEHARAWTTRYPVEAMIAMRAVQRQAAAADYAGIDLPVLALLAEGDTVVDPAATRRVLAGWGGPVRIEVIEGADHRDQHVIAGRILSPSTTDRVAGLIAGWIAELEPARAPPLP